MAQSFDREDIDEWVRAIFMHDNTMKLFAMETFTGSRVKSDRIIFDESL